MQSKRIPSLTCSFVVSLLVFTLVPSVLFASNLSGVDTVKCDCQSHYDTTISISLSDQIQFNYSELTTTWSKNDYYGWLRLSTPALNETEPYAQMTLAPDTSYSDDNIAISVSADSLKLSPRFFFKTSAGNYGKLEVLSVDTCLTPTQYSFQAQRLKRILFRWQLNSGGGSDLSSVRHNPLSLHAKAHRPSLTISSVSLSQSTLALSLCTTHSFPDLSVRLFDVFGKLITASHSPILLPGKHTIPLSPPSLTQALPPGVYFFSITAASQQIQFARFFNP